MLHLFIVVLIMMPYFHPLESHTKFILLRLVDPAAVHAVCAKVLHYGRALTSCVDVANFEVAYDSSLMGPKSVIISCN